MPKRPNQHQIEDTSRAKFKLILPRKWVFRDKEKDYGIDGEVEIFDESNKATGFVFGVQLKATESTKKSTITNVDIAIDTLKYYKNLDIPVLLVRYSDSENSFYIKWINNVDLFYAKKNSKSFRINLTDNNKWNNTSSNEINKHLIKLRTLQAGSFRFPIPITIEILENKINNISKQVFLSQIRKHLIEYSDFVNYENSEDNSLINIKLDNKKLTINACDLLGCTFHNIDHRRESSFAPTIVKNILLGIAIGMLQIGQVEYCGRIIFNCKLENELLEKEDILLYVLPKLFESSYFEKVLNIIIPILNSPNSYKVEILTKLSILFNSKSKNESKSKIIEKFLLHLLSDSFKSEDKTQIGISNYNLGNHYRGRGLYELAIKHYIAAKKYAPIYLKQHYFYSELAGVFFLTNRFKYSAKLYSKSIELGGPIITKALYGDALMFEGKYEESRLVFIEYIENTDNPLPEYLLKAVCLGKLIKDTTIKKQNRNSIEANLSASIIDPQLIDKIVHLQKALDFDLLCSLAWFNLGMENSQLEQMSIATFCFAMCGLIQTGDIDAWVNATLSSLNQKTNTEIIPLIIRTAYFYNRENYLEELYSRLGTNEAKEIADIIEMIEKTLIKDRKVNNPLSLRVLNEKGIFVNMFEN